MRDFQLRTIPLLTEKGLEILENSKISIAGLGGNGGTAFIELVRYGIKKFKLADDGIYDITDLNRQFGARRSTLGRKKN